MFTTAIALAKVNLGLIVDLAGATGATMLSFVAPAFLYYKLFAHPVTSPIRIGAIVVGTLGLCSGVIGVILAFAQAAGHPEAHIHHPELPPKPH